jgi:mRNA-degrading endonuclease toxin of MazEF toxin-antitoxin module
LCHQITALEREKLVAPLGVLPTDPLRDVERGIKAALDLGGVMP